MFKKKICFKNLPAESEVIVNIDIVLAEYNIKVPSAPHRNEIQGHPVGCLTHIAHEWKFI